MPESRKSLIDLVLVVGGKVASIGVIFAGGAIVARFGGPAEYGLFATAITAILLLEGMIGSPLDIGAIRFSALHAGEEARTRRFEAMSLQVKLLVVVVVMAGWTLWHRGDGGDWSQALLLTMVVTLLLAARSTVTGLQIRQRFKAYSLVDLGQGAARLALFGLLAALGLSRSTPFLLAYGSVSLLVVLVGFGLFRQGYLLGGWPTGRDVRRMFGYCGCAAGVVSLGTLTGRGDLLILSSWFPPETVANYGAAAQLFLLLAQLSLYISVVTQPRVLTWTRAGKLRTLFAWNAALVGLGLLPALLLFFNPGLLAAVLTLVFGPGYEGAALPFRILLFGGLIDLLLVPILMIYVLQVFPGKAFAAELVTTATFVGVAFFLIPRGDPAVSQVSMAWLAVGIRALKLSFYFVLFWRTTGGGSTAIPPEGTEPSPPGEPVL